MSKVNSSHFVLAAIAVASTLLYLFATVLPYNLFDLYTQPKLAVYRFAQNDPTAIWRLALVWIVLCGLWWLGWRTAQRVSGKTAWSIVIGGSLASGLALLFMYPFDAADIFDYAMHGRITSIYGGNPFRDTATQFPNDPFHTYTGWPSSPSFYGPAWEWVDAIVTRFTGDSIITNVLAFKGVGGVFLAACAGLIALILRHAAPERTLAGVTFLAWNPVVLWVTLGNGHNDIVIVCCMLAAVLAMIHSRYTLAVLALVLGALFKFIPALLLPAAGLIALRNLPDTRARLSFLVTTGLSSAVLIVLVYAPFWYGPSILDIGGRMRVFTASLPAFLYNWLGPVWGRGQVASVVSLTALGLTAIFALWQGWRASRNPTWLGFTHAGLNTLLFYLLLACAWFQQWYTIWPLGLAALLPPGASIYLAMVLGGYTVLSKQIVFGPLIWRIHPPPRAQRELWFAPAVLGLPWVFAVLALLQKLSKHISRQRAA